MQGKFTQKAQEVVKKAQEYAGQLGHNYLGTEHILLGLSSVADSVSAKANSGSGCGRVYAAR